MVRPTSTSQNPLDKLPERIKRKRLLEQARELIKLPDGYAAVSKVLACDLKDYDEGRGLEEVFGFHKEVPKDPADLIFKGNSIGFTMELELEGSRSDTLMAIKLPDEQYRIAIRLFDPDRRVEVMTKSRSTGSSFTERCWVIYFDGYLDKLRQSKNMLRRLLNTMEEMPVDGFTYRNFMPSTNKKTEDVGEDDLAPASEPLVTHYEGGITWRFTGSLSSPAFQKGYNSLPKEAEQIDEDTLGPVVRSATGEGIKTPGRAARKGIRLPTIPTPKTAKKAAKQGRRRKACQEKAAQALPLRGSGTETLQRSVAHTSETLQRFDDNTSETLPKRKRSDGSATETL